MKKCYIILMLSFAALPVKAVDPRDHRNESKIYQVPSQQYAYIYNMADQTVTPHSAVNFDSNGVSSTGISHAPGDSKIVINETGVYVITFLVQGVPANSFALFQNNAYVPGSSYEPSLAITDRSTKEFGQVIIQAKAGDVITLQNYSPVLGRPSAILKAAGKPSVNASVLIMQLIQS